MAPLVLCYKGKLFYGYRHGDLYPWVPYAPRQVVCHYPSTRDRYYLALQDSGNYYQRWAIDFLKNGVQVAQTAGPWCLQCGLFLKSSEVRTRTLLHVAELEHVGNLLIEIAPMFTS